VAKAKQFGTVHVGCAGWALAKEHSSHFPSEGTHLARYAGRLSAVEINSSFYRPHRPATYAKWADSVPEDFRFAVKIPKEATHTRRLVNAADVLDRFLSEVTSLGGKLGPLLVQLPPSLEFSTAVAAEFFTTLRDRFKGDIVLEPRHPTWFMNKADGLVQEFRVARVAADPAVVAEAAEPGGWDTLVYYRLHGSPKTYYSPYSAEYLKALSEKLLLAARAATVWCIFDNTAAGAATVNALDLHAQVRV
jgi:uncharacterized protein YecE (DUF72 family)